MGTGICRANRRAVCFFRMASKFKVSQNSPTHPEITSPIDDLHWIRMSINVRPEESTEEGIITSHRLPEREWEPQCLQTLLRGPSNPGCPPVAEQRHHHNNCTAGFALAWVIERHVLYKYNTVQYTRISPGGGLVAASGILPVAAGMPGPMRARDRPPYIRTCTGRGRPPRMEHPFPQKDG